MEFIEAVDWVNRNGKLIRRKIEIFRTYSPFEERDYLQETYSVAFVAVGRSCEKCIPFEAAFWTLFKQFMAEMTPNFLNASAGSNSVPSNLCVVELDSIDIPGPEASCEPDIEQIYLAVCGFLTRREQQVLSLALGITQKGRMSNYEIAKHLGCRESNVRDALNKALERIRTLVKVGKIKPAELL